MIEMLIFIVASSLCAYMIVDRICRCFENTSMAKAVSLYMQNGGKVDEIMEKAFKDSRKIN